MRLVLEAAQSRSEAVCTASDPRILCQIVKARIKFVTIAPGLSEAKGFDRVIGDAREILLPAK